MIVTHFLTSSGPDGIETDSVNYLTKKDYALVIIGSWFGERVVELFGAPRNSFHRIKLEH